MHALFSISKITYILPAVVHTVADVAEAVSAGALYMDLSYMPQVHYKAAVVTDKAMAEVVLGNHLTIGAVGVAVDNAGEVGEDIRAFVGVEVDMVSAAEAVVDAGAAVSRIEAERRTVAGRNTVSGMNIAIERRVGVRVQDSDQEKIVMKHRMRRKDRRMD